MRMMQRDVSILTNSGVNVAKSLELFGDMETYDSSLEDFLEGTEVRLRKINQLKGIADMPNYAIEVHALKSDAKYFGFEKLAELASQHEIESKNQNMYYVYEHFNELMSEATSIVNLAKRYLGKEVVVTVSAPVEVEKTKTILVVDDSTVVSNFIKKLFQDDYNVIIADDGLEALNIIAADEQKKIVAMLLDLNMPKVDGFAVLEYFKERNLFGQTPVSVMTGESNEELINKAMAYPIISILRKPFNERDIKSSIERTIEARIN
jgi:CheY-like chemotaxis protein